MNMHHTLSSRVIGYVASLVLTLAAYFAIVNPQVLPLSVMPTILVLAILQAIVQLIFFLHVLSERKPHWNLIVFASTLSIVIVIVVFTLWVMHHLCCNMMP